MSAQTVVIEPCKRRVKWREVFQTRAQVTVLAQRDFKIRYKQAALGPIWLLIQPLGILAAFTVVFGEVAEVDTGGIPYALFAIVGTTVWTFASTAIGFGARAHVANQKLIKLIPSSRVAYVTATVLSALPYLVIPLVLTIAAILIAGRSIPVQVVTLPLLTAWLIVFLWGATLALSSVNVRFRDIGAAVPFMLQGGLFLTPIAYPLTETEGAVHTVLALNPLTGILESWRWALLGSDVDMLGLSASLGFTVLFLLAGWALFTRLEPRMADVI